MRRSNCPEVSKRGQKWPKVSISVQSVQKRQKLSKSVKNCPKASNSDQNVQKRPTCTIASKRVRTVQSVQKGQNLCFFDTLYYPQKYPKRQNKCCFTFLRYKNRVRPSLYKDKMLLHRMTAYCIW